jgi:MFS family permease
VSAAHRVGLAVAAPVGALRSTLAEFPRVVLVLASGDLVASFGFSLFFPFLTIYLVQELGASAAQAGLVIAAYSLFSTVSGIAGGWLADRVGRRPVLIGSISATAVLVMSMAFASEAWHVALVMVILGCVDPAFPPAARAAVADTVDEVHRPRAFGLLGVANAIGWIAGPVIGAGLSILGYPLLFGLSGLLVASYVPIALRWLPETRPDRAVGAPASQGAGPVADGAAAAEPDRQDARGLALRRRLFIAFLPLVAVTHALTFLWVTTLPIYAAGGLAVPTPVWGLLFGINGLLIVLFQLRIATACERRSKPRVMALAVVLYAGGLGLVGFVTPSVAVVGLAATICLVTVGEMLLMPVVPSFVSELSPVARRATYQGVALAAISIGSGLGPPIAGLMLDTAPAELLWLGAAGILLLLAVGFVVLGRAADRLAVRADA